MSDPSPQLLTRDSPRADELRGVETLWQREFGDNGFGWDEAWLWADLVGYALFTRHARLRLVPGMTGTMSIGPGVDA